MTTDTKALKQEIVTRAAPREHRTVRDLVERMKPELVKSLGTEQAVEALGRHYLTAIRQKPQLLECTGESLLAALLLSAQVGLEPGPLGHVYLVPYKGECVWILGYTGIVELSRRSERAAGLEATVIWDCDDYVAPWRDEKGVHFRLRPGAEQDRGERVCVLVTWQERQGGRWLPRAVEVPRSRVERAKKASPAFRAKSGPWMTDETAMWSKTGVRDVRRWLPLSPQAGYAVASDDGIVRGLDVDEAGAAQPIVDAEPEAVVADAETPADGTDGHAAP